MKRALIATAAALAVASFGLAGCETATPYQPIAVQRGAEQQVALHRLA